MEGAVDGPMTDANECIPQKLFRSDDGNVAAAVDEDAADDDAADDKEFIGTEDCEESFNEVTFR